MMTRKEHMDEIAKLQDQRLAHKKALEEGAMTENMFIVTNESLNRQIMHHVDAVNKIDGRS